MSGKREKWKKSMSDGIIFSHAYQTTFGMPMSFAEEQRIRGYNDILKRVLKVS